VAWAVIEVGWGRVAVVVVGVTPHQGGMESISQGEGPQVKALQVMGVRRCETSEETLSVPGTSRSFIG